jgi:NAD(P)-dependent dehydrogenase (short-subunit alcohol dehydrogenase family)
MTIQFQGRVAIVTGAGSGLGRSHALGLAARGAKVVVNDLGRNGAPSDNAVSVVEEIRAAGGAAMADPADVADFEQVSSSTTPACCGTRPSPRWTWRISSSSSACI